MASLDDHPSVRRARERAKPATASAPLSSNWLKALALEQGASDAGLVEISRPALQDQVGYIRQVYAGTKTLLAFCVRMNAEPVRSPVRSVANQEFHATYDEVNEVARKIVTALADAGVPACNAVAAFPMEVQLPGRAWTVAHKPVAVAAGLGRMGIHRSVIHPRYGSFVLLGTILIGAEADGYDQPVDYNPCLECKLCVAACPVGALKPDGAFDLFTCYTHNYREFLGNFSDFVGAVVASDDMTEFRERFSEGETSSMWQSLSFKPGYKAAYCLAVCPAGDDVIQPFLEDRPAFLESVVRPLQAKVETLYVVADSDAEVHARERFPHKPLKRVPLSMEVSSITSFAAQLKLGFQRGRAKGLTATYHWTFTGREDAKLTVRIADQRVSVEPGHVGEADVHVTADTSTWLRILNHRYALATALERSEVHVRGDSALFEAFGRCFLR